MIQVNDDLLKYFIKNLDKLAWDYACTRACTHTHTQVNKLRAKY